MANNPRQLKMFVTVSSVVVVAKDVAPLIWNNHHAA
jgi:hypothetical protein